MVQVIYTKSLSDFATSLNPSQLMDEINLSSIVPTCITIENSSNDVNIVFDESLSIEEQVILNGLVANHVPSTRTFEKPFPIIDHNFDPPKNVIPTQTSNILSYFYYHGSQTTKDPQNNGYVIYNGDINFILRDVDNNKDIMTLSVTGSGIVPKTAQLPDLQNLPSTESTFQLSYRLTSGTKGKIYSFHLD